MLHRHVSNFSAGAVCNKTPQLFLLTVNDDDRPFLHKFDKADDSTSIYVFDRLRH
jgi:hypothetical protein